MSSVQQSDVIVLDVGGSRFHTTAGTLTKFSGSFFGSLFSGKYPLTKSTDGSASYSVFIDRDGSHFLKILNFLRSGRLVMPLDQNARKELMIEAEFYCLKDQMLKAWHEEERLESEESNSCKWESNVIFIGYKNIDFELHKKELGDSVQHILQKIQCPDSTEHVWKSIHDAGLTTIFPITAAAPNGSDFSLKNIKELVDAIQSWDRPNLRFVLVYDAELIRELLKLSGQKFNDSSYVWFFSRGKLVECVMQKKLKYITENVWKHYYLSIETER